MEDDKDTRPLKIGVIGCGDISGAYLRLAREFPILDVVACASRSRAASDAASAEFGIVAMDVDELFGDPDIECVLNLTPASVHHEINLSALQADKHVYSEKPLCATTDQAKEVLTEANERGLCVGCAPDTFLGAAYQTARGLIDEGAIGRPVAGIGNVMMPGPELRPHPNPEIFYEKGAGPLFDLGPYHLTNLVNLLGPVRSVIGNATKSGKDRVIASGPKQGQTISVETPTHVTGVLTFVSGALVTLTASFDVWSHGGNAIEIYGDKGSLILPDPNWFNGPIRVFVRTEDWSDAVQADPNSWRDIPYSHGYQDRNHRGIGLADMARAIRTGRPHRASGDLAYHVLEVMEAFEASANTGSAVAIRSTVERPAALPESLPDGELD